VPVRDLLEKIEHGFHWMANGRERDQSALRREKRVRNYKWISILALIALVLQSGMLFLALFEPGLPYKVARGPVERLDDPHFVKTLEALTGAQMYQWSHMEVLTNGENFYAAELAAIRQAKRSINIEAYIFSKGEVADMFVKAMAERARAGVQVNVIVDAIGAFSQTKAYFDELIDAGGQVKWYHPLRWNTWPRINNRTHRELFIIDGTVGFIGGAGVADHWYKKHGDDLRWRDTMVRVEGEAVTGLQAIFSENWLEASGEVLTGYDYFPFHQAPVRTTAMVVGSSPTTGRSTTARVLFQLLIASATKSIHITTPYFLPDNSAVSELVKAVKRGIEVHIVVPGIHSDHAMTRSSSRRLYGDLLEAGAKIFEYRPSMIHAKTLIVDGLWGVVGSTNFDSRSFSINDEVNLAVMDRAFAARLDADFIRDRGDSREITYDQWKRRPHIERAQEWFGRLLQRQQ
jgi:cardiolipin synthase A/B